MKEDWKVGEVFLCKDNSIRVILSVSKRFIQFSHKDTLYFRGWAYPPKQAERKILKSMGFLPVVLRSHPSRKIKQRSK